MAHSSHLEIERKYDVDAGAVVPELVGIGPIAVVEGPETIELDARYFDTASLRLATRRIALRRRSGGDDEGWHIKSDGDEGRTELRWPLEGDDVPEEIRQHLSDIVGDEELVPIARVLNERIARRLLDAAGYPIAEIVDDHVRSEDLRGGGRSGWREWEVELLAAAPDTRKARTALLDEIELRVFEAGAQPAASASKLARALGR
jgi:hypothetical protein